MAVNYKIFQMNFNVLNVLYQNPEVPAILFSRDHVTNFVVHNYEKEDEEYIETLK